jgi:recombination protein RecA
MNEAQRLALDLITPREVMVDISTETGIYSLDVALGGSLPAGAVEIYGEASTGKTSLLYSILAYAQRANYETALCASEYLDLPYMKKLGVDLNQLPILTGNYAEDVLEAAVRFMEERPRSLVAIDSATALRPKDEEPGFWSACIDAYLETMLSALPLRSCILMVNQVRSRRSVDPSKFFAGGTDSSAAKIAAQFSARLELSRSEVSDNDYTMNVNIVANTLAAPCRVSPLPFVKGSGVDRELDYVRQKLEKKEGGWYELFGQKVQGERAAAALLRQDPQEFEDRRYVAMLEGRVANQGH